MRRRVAAFALLVVLVTGLVQCNGSTDAASDDLPLPERGPGSDGGRHEGDGSTLDANGGDDSSVGLDGGEDASLPACDRAKPFGAPTHLAGAWVATEPYSTPRLSADELTIYFTTRSAAGDSDMASATRATISTPFGAPTLLTTLNSAANDNDPSVSADHLSIWFHSSRDGDPDIFTATRATTASPWGMPTPVGPVNSPSSEAHAYYRQSANELWLISNRGTSYDIYMSTKVAGVFGTPQPIAALNSPLQDWQPQPSEDGLTMLLASDRAGGKGGLDLYLSQRANAAAVWDAPVAIAELNSANVEQAGWLSADGCRIYFSSDRDAPAVRNALWFAARPR
jgi:Tol biopolymer transport system component